MRRRGGKPKHRRSARPGTEPPARGAGMSDLLERLTRAAAPTVSGRVVRAVGLSVDISGLQVAVGEAVTLQGERAQVLAEVVALHDDVATCMPVSDLRGV